MKLILSSDQEKWIEPEAELIKLRTDERFKIALQKFALFFALAIASIFIPVFHFVLVPAFLLISVVMGIKAYKIQYRLQIHKECLCVQCQAPLKTEFLLDEQRRLRCGNCFAHYLIEE